LIDSNVPVILELVIEEQHKCGDTKQAFSTTASIIIPPTTGTQLEAWINERIKKMHPSEVPQDISITPVAKMPDDLRFSHSGGGRHNVSKFQWLYQRIGTLYSTMTKDDIRGFKIVTPNKKRAISIANASYAITKKSGHKAARNPAIAATHKIITRKRLVNGSDGNGEWELWIQLEPKE
jgi:hypothetical protein